MLAALALGDLAGGQVVEALVGEPGDLGVEQAEVDALAEAGHAAIVQRRQDRAYRVHAAHDVGDADADLHRLAVRLAGQAPDAAHALGEVVVAGARRVGSRLAEAGDRAVDDAGLALLPVVVSWPVAPGVPALVVLDQDVALTPH